MEQLVKVSSNMFKAPKTERTSHPAQVRHSKEAAAVAKEGIALAARGSIKPSLGSNKTSQLLSLCHSVMP